MKAEQTDSPEGAKILQCIVEVPCAPALWGGSPQTTASKKQTVFKTCVHNQKKQTIVRQHLKDCSVCHPDMVLKILFERSQANHQKHDQKRTKNFHICKNVQNFISKTFCRYSVQLFRDHPETIDRLLVAKIISSGSCFDALGAYSRICQTQNFGISEKEIENFYRLNMDSPPGGSFHFGKMGGYTAAKLHVEFIKDFPDLLPIFVRIMEENGEFEILNQIACSEVIED